MTPQRLTFPPDFLWGAATSAYQIEGSVARDGRGVSIWDTFSHTPGRTVAGDTGDVAADHYQRYATDVALMAGLGLRAYRFSTSWPRVQPTGAGRPLAAGLDFYKRLVDALRGAGIEPWVTLYHWDLPQALEDAGGWTSRETALRFADYAGHVRQALGDGVRFWTTLNEPWCSAFLAYGSGHHAPGRREPWAAVAATHHLLLGHGLAVQALRAGGASDVGITLNAYPVEPASDRDADRDAARRVDGLHNRLFLDPLLLGSYPDDVRADLAPTGAADRLCDDDLPAIAAPLDLLGVNYYSRHHVSGGPAGTPALAYPGSEHVELVRTGRPVTAMGWEVDGSGLVEVLERVAARYPALPLYVTENGAAYDDVVGPDGSVADPDRVAYLRDHLLACHQALAAGVPLRGYFVWSLLDNFEWAWGFSKRFGIVHVDFATQRRTPKASARWYADVLAHGLPAPVGRLR